MNKLLPCRGSKRKHFKESAEQVHVKEPTVRYTSAHSPTSTHSPFQEHESVKEVEPPTKQHTTVKPVRVTPIKRIVYHHTNKINTSSRVSDGSYQSDNC